MEKISKESLIQSNHQLLILKQIKHLTNMELWKYWIGSIYENEKNPIKMVL